MEEIFSRGHCIEDTAGQPLIVHGLSTFLESRRAYKKGLPAVSLKRKKPTLSFWPLLACMKKVVKSPNALQLKLIGGNLHRSLPIFCPSRCFPVSSYSRPILSGTGRFSDGWSCETTCFESSSK